MAQERLHVDITQGNIQPISIAVTDFVSDGKQVYALVDVEDTPFSFRDVGVDWKKITVKFERPPDYSSSGSEIEFLNADPRVIVVPVDAVQVSALGVKVYPWPRTPSSSPTPSS